MERENSQIIWSLRKKLCKCCIKEFVLYEDLVFSILVHTTHFSSNQILYGLVIINVMPISSSKFTISKTGNVLGSCYFLYNSNLMMSKNSRRAWREILPIRTHNFEDELFGWYLNNNKIMVAYRETWQVNW